MDTGTATPTEFRAYQESDRCPKGNSGWVHASSLTTRLKHLVRQAGADVSDHGWYLFDRVGEGHEAGITPSSPPAEVAAALCEVAAELRAIRKLIHDAIVEEMTGP